MHTPIRVLLVDDEESFWKPMRDRLTQKGFQVEVATNHIDALTKAEACKGDFRVAVIDHVMGPPNGTEIMLQLRRLYPDIEAIILTGWGDMKPGERAMELGAYRYMSKPVTAEELALNIRTAARFGQERQHRLSLQALVRAGQRVSGAQSEEELYQRLYEEARELLPGLDSFLICLWDELNQTASFPFCHVRGKRESRGPRQGHKGITEFVIQSKEPLLLPDGDESFRREYELNTPQIAGNATSEIDVPMFLEGRVIGTLAAMTYHPAVHYTREHLEVFQAFANQAAVAIQSVRQLEEARQLRDAVAALASQRGKEAVLRGIVAEGHKLVTSDYTSLILQDEDGTLYKAGYVFPRQFADLDNSFDQPRQQGGVSRAVVEKREPIIIPDTSQNSLVKEEMRKAGIRSMMAIPLIYGDRVLGILYAHNLQLKYFSEHDVNLWSAFAAQAAAALHSALEEEREIEDARRLARELGDLTGKLDLNETMTRVAGAAKAIFQADTCRLAYVDPPTGRIVAWTWAEGDPEAYRYEGAPRPDGVTYHVLQTKKPVFRSDADVQAKPFPPLKFLEQGLKSFASLPLVHNGRVTGVLHCNYLKRQRPFHEHDQTLFAAFSAHAAMALDRTRRDQMDAVWQELDRQIVTCSNLKTLYTLFANHALQALHADFAVFYPYDPTTIPAQLLEEDYVSVGDLRTPWSSQRGGFGGGVHRALEDAPDGLLIVNDLQSKGGQLNSRLAEREGVKAYVALRLDVVLEGQNQPRLAGMLFLNFRKVTVFEQADLAGLRLAGDRVAAAILRLHLQSALQQHREQLLQQLRAMVDIFHAYRERLDGRPILERIAEAIRDAWHIDVCTVLAYDSREQEFSELGAAGLLVPMAGYSVPREFKTWFLDKREPIVIPDALYDERMYASTFVQREGIQSVVVYPLWVENEALGLLFANYRHHREPPNDEIDAIGLFANLAALVLNETNLREKLIQTQRQLERRTLLTWVSMLEDTWRHSLVQKAAAIRNYTAFLQKRFVQCLEPLPTHHHDIQEKINEIDRLASEIAQAPVRVPQSWEMEPELFPLAPLLEELAQREDKLSLLQAGPPVEIKVDIEALGGTQVQGYRRWLVYALESLLQNARKAMPQGGTVSIRGQRAGEWAEIRIQDTGEGVPEPIRDRLFRERIPARQDRAGMGIGGLLAATIVEEQGGSIALEKPGPGDTTVLIRLPMIGEIKE